LALLEERLLRDLAHKKDLVRTAAGDLDTIAGLRNLKEAMLRRLVTQPGSLVHRPDYGVGLKDYVNSVNTLAGQESLALRIKEQFERDDRIESVESMSFDVQDELPDRLTIFVKVNIRGFQEAQFEFVPFGGGGVI
jgi:phage baseplate assembly protein W